MSKLFLLILLLMAPPALAVELAANSTIDRDSILLGDVFTGIDDKASKVLGKAPAPGEKMILSAEQLQRLAVNNELAWRPASASQTLVLTRASQFIDVADLQTEVELALQQEMPQTRLSITFDRTVAPVHLPASAPAALRVQHLAYDANSNRFNARVVLAEGSPHEQTLTVTGRYTRLMEVPVPVTRLPQEHIITERDLTWLEVPENSVNRGTVASLKQLIGMEVRRTLAENSPIRASDVTEPQLISKGDMVVMEVTTPFMSLTAQGRALENGRLHDVIRILNIASRQVVQGTVIAKGRVQVGAALVTPIQQSALTDNTVRSR